MAKEPEPGKQEATEIYGNDIDEKIKASSPDMSRDCLLYLDKFSETVVGLPYSLWALLVSFWCLGWLLWLATLWGSQVVPSLSLKMSQNQHNSRFCISLPLSANGGHKWPRAHHSQVHSELYLRLC